MGKKNRIRNKLVRYRSSKKTSMIPSIIPILQKINCSKEIYVDELKKLFSKYLKDFQNFTQIRIESKASMQIKLNLNFKIFSCSDYQNFIIDPSNEYSHIFYIHLNRFLNSLILQLKEVYMNHQSIFNASMQDALKLIEAVSKDASKITSDLYNFFDIDFLLLSFELFKEKIQADNFLKDQLSRLEMKKEVNVQKDAEICNGKLDSKKNKKKKKKNDSKTNGSLEDELLDKEIEDFTTKLNQDTGVFNKYRPKISDEWILNLRKRLKERLFLKAF